LRNLTTTYANKLKTTRNIAAVIERTKTDRRKMDSAGVECGSNMLGTGLSLGGFAAHSPAARRIPARMTIIPMARPAIAPHFALRVVPSIFLNLSLAPTHSRSWRDKHRFPVFLPVIAKWPA
jgi:hypothetical protein